MFKEIWKLITSNQLAEAKHRLSSMEIEDEYLKSVALIIQSEIAFRQKKYEDCFHLNNEALPKFANPINTLEDLTHDRTGIGITFLEHCVIFCSFAKLLMHQKRWAEAWDAVNAAKEQWENYSLSRLPYLKIPEAANWSHLPTEIDKNFKRLAKELDKKPSKRELLDLLAPDHFTPNLDFAPKMNKLSGPNPLVSVCIASYCDGPWLQETVDAVLANAGYENLEIVVVYQKKNKEEAVEPFLEDKKYTENPKIKIFIFDQPLYSEGAKQIAYEKASGELLVSIDAHIIPCKDLVKKTVKLFWENPEVSLLNYGLVETREDRVLRYFYFNEIPYHFNGMIGHVVIDKPSKMMIHKPGIYIRQCLIGTFCIMKHVFEEVGGYVIKQHSWGDKCLGMSAYLYGYQVYVSPEISCIHKWHEKRHQEWRDTHRRTERFEYVNELPVASLLVGDFYFSKEYFERFFVPWMEKLCGDTFDKQWKLFQEQRHLYADLKSRFWQKAVRSVREFWLEHGDYIYLHLSEQHQKFLCNDFDPTRP